MEELREQCAVRNVDALEKMLSEPNDATIQAMASLDGDIVILGVGGKMGPTLSRMAKRASDLAGVKRRIIGVSRFSGSPKLEDKLHSWGIETHRCDLLDLDSYPQLPDAANLIFMAGMKFGSTGQEPLTWAMNTFIPGLVSHRYRDSRIAVFSTGNVYGLSPVASGGSLETDALHPAGEYALSCLGRERIFEHFSRAYQTKLSILRLNYAVELRYGVLLDIARRVYAGQPIPLQMGYFNAIWQGDASAMTLRSLSHASLPPFVVNIAGPELLSVARIATEFGNLLHKPVHFEGTESGDALLSNAGKAFQSFGRPNVSIGRVLSWIAEWVGQGRETFDKPTHFENRAGNF
ncbi:MAG TPA: NAD-dependent epimerase/dehydratase family protein [Terracidiphilus sp.]|nr:NAD-dependent epimerase/dehydratase family protein [Terracidiphilus sp.]